MKQNRYFYQHLYDCGDILTYLEEIGLSEREQYELINIVQHTIHLEVMNFILGELPEEHHPKFLQYAEERTHDRGLLVFLRRSINQLEEQITRVIARVKQDFLHELDQYKQASKEWLEGL